MVDLERSRAAFLSAADREALTSALGSFFAANATLFQCQGEDSDEEDERRGRILYGCEEGVEEGAKGGADGDSAHLRPLRLLRRPSDPGASRRDR